jgi:hypothetical protein
MHRGDDVGGGRRRTAIRVSDDVSINFTRDTRRTRMKLYGADNRELMTISEITRDGNTLVVRGRIFGAMPMTAKLRPEEARAALKLLDFRTILFLISLFFRRR